MRCVCLVDFRIPTFWPYPRATWGKTVLSMNERYWCSPSSRRLPPRELYLVVHDGQVVRLAALANRERQCLAVLGDLKFRVIHHFALHLVRNLQSVRVRALAGGRGS